MKKNVQEDGQRNSRMSLKVFSGNEVKGSLKNQIFNTLHASARRSGNPKEGLTKEDGVFSRQAEPSFELEAR